MLSIHLVSLGTIPRFRPRPSEALGVAPADGTFDTVAVGSSGYVAQGWSPKSLKTRIDGVKSGTPNRAKSSTAFDLKMMALPRKDLAAVCTALYSDTRIRTMTWATRSEWEKSAHDMFFGCRVGVEKQEEYIIFANHLAERIQRDVRSPTTGEVVETV